MRQSRRMEFLKGYDFTLHYHPGKANVVADAFSRKSQGVLASIASREWQMLETVGQFGLHYSDQAQGTLGICLTKNTNLSPKGVSIPSCYYPTHKFFKSYNSKTSSLF